ncbi:B3/4 domain-containing protein [Geobacter sp. FeAm09]|uniref:B3/B4 domain-containing protein n=1 Tax=Geobacter sp. FeAm09 TaxID=2597769 RepID=UPI00197AA6D9|nr:phenylalanine--tRNA ligase beta subunit-related protein [Geobacter sp. FeAm09]
MVAHNVVNGVSPAPLVELLREAEGSVREQIGTAEITAHPRIAAWRDAFKKVGIKASEYRPSTEAMARRALRNQELPCINALVDIGNVLSLRHLVSMGGHAIDVVTRDMVLRTASGEEEFIAFGSDQVEHPVPGEIIFAEGAAVLTRRWCWRQANHTLTLPETTAIEFNIDGLPPVSPGEVEQICRETMELVQRFCGGTCRYGVITRHNPKVHL